MPVLDPRSYEPLSDTRKPRLPRASCFTLPVKIKGRSGFIAGWAFARLRAKNRFARGWYGLQKRDRLLCLPSIENRLVDDPLPIARHRHDEYLDRPDGRVRHAIDLLRKDNRRFAAKQ